MNNSPTRIFIETVSLDDFRRAIAALTGDFIFDTEEMLRLGEAYFSRYPDSFSHRSSQEVLMGYEVVRICILEKIMMNFDVKSRECICSMVRDISLINPRVQACIAEVGRERVGDMLAAAMKTVEGIKFDIDSLPLGMVKERFIGGIAIFYNISYIVKLALDSGKQ